MTTATDLCDVLAGEERDRAEEAEQPHYRERSKESS